jgi:D-glycero-D-manno-heptose 1,7-bisphosphate phosphatase
MPGISQAVILAGGRGTRLAPLTDTRPKPLIEIAGRPFIDHLLEMIRGQGIRRVAMLLGYKAQMIVDHLGDGSRFGLEISHSVTPEADETGRRLRAAAELLDPEFLLMYCDNYWPLRLERLWRSYKNSGAAMQIAVYDNSDGYTRDNVRVEDGFVAVYDKSRTAPDLKGVDIGFAILRRDLLDRLPNGNPSFEAALYPELVAQRQLAAFVTGHRYYSIGSHARLPLTETFLARRPAVILDRDGVLNQRMPRAEYVRRWPDWRWKDGAIEALRRFAAAGWRVIVVTNQAGIARGAMTEGDLAAIHERMCAEAAAAGGRIDAIYHCPHGWDEGCACRKPAPGMLFQAQRAFDLDLSRVSFVGDDERDGQAAEAAGCRFVPAENGMPLSRIADRIINEWAPT